MSSRREEPILILAPTGDATLAHDALREAGVDVRTCDGMESLCASADAAAAIMVAEEALAGTALASLAAALGRQPLWSDLPVLILTVDGSGSNVPRVLRALEPVGNVTLVDRPLRPIALRNVARAALRTRRRQHALQKLQEDLEERVRERTAELELLSDIATMANHAESTSDAVLYCLEHVARLQRWLFGHAYFRAPGSKDELLPFGICYPGATERFAALRDHSSQSLRPGQGLPGRVFSTGRAAWTTDIDAEFAERGIAPAASAGILSAIAFPVAVGQDVLGVLEFFSGERIGIDQGGVISSLASVGTPLGRVMEREAAALALRESEARLRVIAEHMRDVVWLHEVEPDRIVYCSPNYQAIWGRSREHLYRDCRDWLETIHGDDRLRARSAYEELLRGLPMDDELRLSHPDGTVRWIRCRGYPVGEGPERCHRVVGIVTDITTRKEAEERAARVAVAEQERIGRDLHDTVGQELVGLALAADRLGGRITQEAGPHASDLRRLAEGIRMALNGVRAAARGLSPIATTGAALVDALHDLAASVRSRHGIACVFEWDGDDDPELPAADVGPQLYRIASEAVANAARHGKPRRILITLRVEGGLVALEVSDDGIGMPPAPAKGRLGLWIMRERASAIKARLEVLPRTTGGTVVRCHLGAADEK